MRLQHIVSTMNKTEFTFLQQMHSSCDVLVVNQNVKDTPLEKTIEKGLEISIKNTDEVGLSNSRNMLLKYATGDICILCDDDIIYRNGYREKILEAYSNYPKADIIVFCFSLDAEKNTRRPFAKPKKINMLSISKVASVEITFKLSSIKKAGLKFDTLLGLGAKFKSGEENAFLADALRAGLKIQYIPWTMCYSLPDETREKWTSGFDKNYFLSKGACYYRIYKNYYIFFSFAFILFKKMGVFKNVAFFKALGWMLQGKKLYLKEKKERRDAN